MVADAFHIYIWIMMGCAGVVFLLLNFINAGYGILRTPQWGVAINNKIAWFLMEFPVFITMSLLFLCSPHEHGPARIAIFALFQLHYLQRAFIFPYLIKGNSKMPATIMTMGATFNILNALMQGYWLFFESYRLSVDFYSNNWLLSAPFIIGLFIFISGFTINLHADHIIRHLRKAPNDTNHYLPKGGLFNKVTSANYLGEIIEWLGFAILIGSLSGFAFFIWTCANLTPRAAAIHKRYKKEFGEEMKNRKLKIIFPYIY